MPSVFDRLGDDEKESYQSDQEKGHHIPNVLVNNVGNLKNVRYKKVLNKFYRNYLPTYFSGWQDEYEFITNTICEIAIYFGSSNLEPFFRSLKRMAETAIFIEKDARESFIHSFQVFLLGSVILDCFYQDFKKWYSTRLCLSEESCLEVSWFMTSIFHDSYKVLETIDEEEDNIARTRRHRFLNRKKHLEAVSSMYVYLKGGKDPAKWTTSTIDIHNQTLTRLLLEHSRKTKDHGVLSALLLMEHLFESSEMCPHIVISALAIASHNRLFRSTLIQRKYFPIDISRFPLTYLLLYCDAAHEWQRYTELDHETWLCNISVSNRSFGCEVFIDNEEVVKLKAKEFRELEEYLLRKHIQLKYSLQIY